jgi:hypothetical protein
MKKRENLFRGGVSSPVKPLNPSILYSICLGSKITDADALSILILLAYGQNCWDMQNPKIKTNYH